MRIRFIVFVGLFLLMANAGTLAANADTSTGQAVVTEHVSVVRGYNHATAVVLPVTIHGEGPFAFELDTGASTSLLTPTLVQRLGLPAAGQDQTISGIGGMQKATPVFVSQWRAGSIRLPSATIVSAVIPHEHGSGLDGLIGSDIWSRFGTFTLDYSRSTLTVYQPITQSSAPPGGRNQAYWYERRLPYGQGCP